MQVLPIQGMFIVVIISCNIIHDYGVIMLQEKKSKEEYLSPEELKKREEALAAAKAWEEATAKTDINATSIKIRETVSIAPEDCVSL